MLRCVKISKQSVKNFRRLATSTNEQLHFYLYRLRRLFLDNLNRVDCDGLAWVYIYINPIKGQAIQYNLKFENSARFLETVITLRVSAFRMTYFIVLSEEELAKHFLV